MLCQIDPTHHTNREDIVYVTNLLRYLLSLMCQPELHCCQNKGSFVPVVMAHLRNKSNVCKQISFLYSKLMVNYIIFTF